MKKALLVITITTMLITACASATPQATAPAPVVSTTAPTAARPAQPTVAQPTVAQPAIVQPTAAAKKISPEFTPTNPKTVKLAAGKVQFVEFFAFW